MSYAALATMLCSGSSNDIGNLSYEVNSVSMATFELPIMSQIVMPLGWNQ